MTAITGFQPSIIGLLKGVLVCFGVGFCYMCIYIYNGSKKVQPYSNASKHVYAVVRTMDIEYSFFGHAIVPSIPNAKWNMHSQCH